MPHKAPWKHQKYLLLSLIILLICLTPTLTRKVSHLPSLVKSSILTETQSTSTEAQTIRPDNKADSDGFFKAFCIMLLAQLKDVSFYAAIIIGFIYNQTFASFSYLFSCIICTLLGLSFVTDVLIFITSIVTGIIAAIFYAIFAILTIYLLYSMRDPEIMADTVPGATKKNLQEAAAQTEAPTQAKLVIEPNGEETLVKEGETMEISVRKEDEIVKEILADEETGLISGRVHREKKEEPKSKFKKFLDDYANLNFFLTQNKRFVYCIIMLLISEMSDFILLGIIDLRRDNTSTRVLVAACVSYLFMASVIFFSILAVKYFMVRKFHIHVDHMKFTKYTGCLLLICLGVIPPIIQATSD